MYLRSIRTDNAGSKFLIPRDYSYFISYSIYFFLYFLRGRFYIGILIKYKFNDYHVQYDNRPI